MLVGGGPAGAKEGAVGAACMVAELNKKMNPQISTTPQLPGTRLTGHSLVPARPASYENGPTSGLFELQSQPAFQCA